MYAAAVSEWPPLRLARGFSRPSWSQHRHHGVQPRLSATAISTREVTSSSPLIDNVLANFRSDEDDGGQSGLPDGYLEIVESINALRPSLAALAEHDLTASSERLKSRYDAGSSLDELLPEAYALVREATYRKLGKAHYDVQLMGGVVLHKGSIAEMATGEGKSLTGILPAYLYALSGESVCMVTVNDYLAKRDAQLFHSVLELLGMEVDFALGPMMLSERQAIYDSANIVYATAQTLAFDYLHDSVAMHPSTLALPTLGFAIIDEVDQILIDNALNPFIISHPASFWNEATEERIRQAIAATQGMVLKQLSITAGSVQPATHTNQLPMLREALEGVVDDYSAALDPQVVQNTLWEIQAFAYEHLGMLPKTLDLFTVKKEERSVEVSRLGFLFVKHQITVMFGIDEQAWRHDKWAALVTNGLTSFMLYLKNVDYAVMRSPLTGKQAIVLIDSSTSRLLPSTKLQGFMHEFIGAKHGLALEPPTLMQTKITYAKLFERFKKLAGMTGTAKESANAFWDNYRLSVISVPPNKPCIRQDNPWQLRRTDELAIEDRNFLIRSAWVSGRPLLIGTASTSASASIYKSVQDALRIEQEGLQWTLADMRRRGETGPLVVEAEDLLQRILNVHIAILNSDERNAQQESMTVAQAGMLGRITVATNMAGRGTDILLGGDPAQLCGLLLAQPYNQHFVDEYMATAGASDGSNGSDESIAADEVKAWQSSFDPRNNATAKKIVDAWQERLQQSQRAGELFHARFHLMFDTIIKTHITAPSGAGNKWTAIEYTDWMKRLQEVVLPLMLSVEKQLPQVSGISLDADRNPPFVTDADQNAHDPMLQQIPLHHLSDDSNMPDALRSAVQRVRHNGQHRIEGADVLCTVCDAAVQDALGNGTLLPSKDMPTDVITYALVAHAWLTWFAAQQRKLIRLGGPYEAENAARILTAGGKWNHGGLVVLQWGAAHNGRIERQLRGRAGRQGDPGESHVIISLEDPTMYPMREDVANQEQILQRFTGAKSQEMLQRNQEALIDIVRMELKKQYRMRIQNEDAALSADVKRDTSLDCWRTMHERLRLSTLHADRSSLLAVYCGLFRQFLPELLQVRRVKIHRGRWGRRRAPTGEVVDASDAGGEGLGPAVDCRQHPRNWDLRAIAALLDEVVNTSASDSPENGTMITYEVISVVNAASLQQFLKKGQGTLPYPGSEFSSLDLWYACNLEASSADENPPLVSRFADALVGGKSDAWRGRFAQQAETLTHYLAQLLVTRLVQKEMLSMDSAMFESTHLRVPILHALDAAWQAVIIEEVGIQHSQGLDSLAALDPEAEYRTRLADSFSVHFRRLAENASRSIFLSLHDNEPDPQWVSVQKSRHKTPAEEANEQGQH